MDQHTSLLAARSFARERERDLQTSVRQRQAEAARGTVAVEPTSRHLSAWFDHLLVRTHLRHATSH